MKTENYNKEHAKDIIERRIKVDRHVAHCEQIEGLYDELFSRYEMCQNCETKVSLVLADIANLDETIPAEQLDQLMSNLCNRIMNMTRSADVVVNFGMNGFAVLLVDCDQYSAAKVCQRFKETIHKVFFLNHQYAKDLEFNFGIADDHMLGEKGAYKLIEDAQSTLGYANNLGNGAIVRASDLSPMSCDDIHPEHFVIGETKHTDK